MSYTTRVRARRKQKEDETPLLFQGEEGMNLLLAQKDAQIETLNDKVNALQAVVRYLQKQLYGASCETLEALGLQIEKSEAEAEEETESGAEEAQEQNVEKAPKQRKKANVRIRQAKVEVIRLVPDEVEKNPQEYEELPLDEQKDVTNRITYIPGHFRVRRYERPRFRQLGKWAGKHILQSEAPANTLGSSPVSESVIAHVIFNKYHQQQPLYRTLREFANNGLEGISEGMLCHWMKVAARRLRPVWMAMHDHLLTEPALHIDETPIRCLPGGGKKEKKASKTPPGNEEKQKKQGYMWTMCSASTGMAHYNWHWEEGRSQAALDLILRKGKQQGGALYDGCIITDGWTAYSSWLEAQGEKRIPQQLCWAHIRRKFVECANSGVDKDWCNKVILKLAELYRIEKELRIEKGVDKKRILERRTLESRPIIEEFYEMLREKVEQDELFMDEKLRLAIGYAATARQAACLYLDHPDLPIDNNAAERSIRPLAIGRKNFLFIGAPDAGETSAILYTMAEECRRCKVNAETWFNETLQTLASGYTGDYLALLPQKSDAEL